MKKSLSFAYLIPFAVLVALALPTAATASRQPADIISIYGYGWGHGVGMCQEGARGMAQAGFRYDAIIKHYYTGVRASTASARIVKVRVLRTGEAVRIVPSGSCSVREAGSTSAVSIAAGRTLTVTSGNGSFTLTDGSKTYSDLKPPLSLTAKPGGLLDILNKTYGRYRGKLQMYIDGDGRTVVLDVLEMEDYLRGVVPSEVSASWPGEALKAQAVAARCYALNSLNGHSFTAWSGSIVRFDLCNSQHCQVFKGVDIEDRRTNEAVFLTSGCVYLPAGSTWPIKAFFGACCGGHTEDSKNVWGGDNSYLKGVGDQYCRGARTFIWRRNIDLGRLRAIMAKDDRTSLTGMTDLTVTLRDNALSDTGSPRVKRMLAAKSGASKSFSGATFKSVLNSHGPAGAPDVFPGSGPQSINETWLYIFMPPDVASFRSAVTAFSPNNDGRLDSAPVDLKTGECRTASINVYDLSGRLVKSIFSGTVSGYRRIYWDGLRTDGNKVPDGRYRFSLRAYGRGSSLARRSSWTFKDTVYPTLTDAGAGSAELKPGGGRTDVLTAVISDKPARTLYLKLVIRDADGRVVRSWLRTAAAQGKNSFTWDGRGAGGAVLPSGSYELDFYCRDAALNGVRDRTVTVRLL